MPTYDYRCCECNHEFETFQAITAAPLKKCPVCGKKALERLIGSGGALIFKGSGFYCTDYRKGRSPGGGSSSSESDTTGPAASGADKGSSDSPATSGDGGKGASDGGSKD